MIRMPKLQKLSAALMTVLCAVVFYLFFAVRYPYHLHFQEQYQLFEFTWAYFVSVASAPGGLADWLGRFVTQFFYYAPAGAAFLAILLVSVQLLCFASCSRKTLPVYALSFIPASLLLAFFCDENALAGALPALIINLGAAVLCLLIKKDESRHITQILSIPLLYMACGSLTIVFVLVTLLRENKLSLPVKLSMLAIIALCPLAAYLVFPYPLQRLFTGIHYYRYHNLVPALLWISAAATVLVVILASFKFVGKNPVAGGVLFVLVAVGGAFIVNRASDMGKEEWMRYDFMVRMRMWNRIMQTADAKNPTSPKTVSCLNLALSMTGRLPDSQFSYFQNGPDGLLPEFQRDHTSPVSTGEAYWFLGMVNTAQRFAFEAQESIPDFQKSARCYVRLAETNIVNGDTDVAVKYLRALEHTMFYRKWARETLELLESGQIFEHRPELARARDFRLKDHDFLFSGDEMDSMLGLLNVENPANTMAVDYLMAWCLLKKDLDRFVECISMVKAPVMPKAYQEALLLRWALTHTDFEGLPPYLSIANARRFNSFIEATRSGKTIAEMQKQFGDTYWFYYYYRYRSNNE